MLGFDDAKQLLAVIVNKFVDLELLISSSNNNQLDNVRLVCDRMRLVIDEQQNTNKLLEQILNCFLSLEKKKLNDEMVWIPLNKEKEQQNKTSDTLLQLVLKQKQEIENEFTKEFPQ